MGERPLVPVILRRVAAAIAVVALATWLSLTAAANAITAGFLFLVAILALAVWQGFWAGALGSLLATGCFNFFFLPPVGTFRITHPENWVSLACFLITATIASRLVVREHERATEALARQREIEALYELCLDLFTASAAAGGLDAATARALRTIGMQSGGLVLPPDDRPGAENPFWVGNPADLEVHRLLERASVRMASIEEPSSGGWRNVTVPVVVAGRPAGALVVYGTRANRSTLESVARLVGLAVEREALLAQRARLSALQSSDALKTALLRAVSHDLSTPLTAISLSVDTLRRELAGNSDALRAVGLVAAETDRLHRRIENLLAMARLEAGALTARREPTPAADLFRAAKENLPLVAAARTIETHVEPDCPDLDVDPSLALEILVNLLENADRASPGGAPIELRARRLDEGDGAVRLEILDRGRGLATPANRFGASEPAALRESGDVPRRGLGLEIARSFASANGGNVRLLARTGGGVAAQIDLPAARVELPLDAGAEVP